MVTAADILSLPQKHWVRSTLQIHLHTSGNDIVGNNNFVNEDDRDNKLFQSTQDLPSTFMKTKYSEQAKTIMMFRAHTV